MFLAGSKRIDDFVILGQLFGFNLSSDVDYDTFTKKPWEKNKLKILKSRHQQYCRDNNIQYKKLSTKHLILKSN